jgi:hypothetical protein
MCIPITLPYCTFVPTCDSTRIEEVAVATNKYLFEVQANLLLRTCGCVITIIIREREEIQALKY